MSKQTINVGSGELVGDGEGIRTAFIKINSNFNELYSNTSTGYTGSIGYTGSQGNVGYTGSASTGTTGYTGSQGNVGYTGSKGDPGPSGGSVSFRPIPVTLLGEVGDEKGNFSFDDDNLYFCFKDYISSNTSVSVIFTGWGSGGIQLERSAITRLEIQEFCAIEPTISSWTLSCGALGVSGIPLTTVGIGVVGQQFAIQIDTNSGPGRVWNGHTTSDLVGESCTLTGPAKIWGQVTRFR